MKYFALLAVLLVMVACAGKDNHPGVFVPDNNNGGSAGRAAHAGSGSGAASGASGASGSDGALSDAGEGGAPDESGLVPVVEITAPKAVSDPDVGPVILEQAHVVCTATKGAAKGASFAASSVVIEAFDAKGKSIQKATGTQNVNLATEFYADFMLGASQVPNGAISFKCTASDMSLPTLSASSVVNTFIDHGPNIAVLSPALPTVTTPLDYYALGVIPFRFSVSPAPLSPGDSEAEVGEVTLTVNNVPIDITKAEDSANPGDYKVDINLADPIIFKVVPNEATSVAITATNKRQPLPASHPDPLTASINYNFGIDGAGPKITITSPSVTNPPVLGRQVRIDFTVVDAQSGVDPSTVVVRLNAQEAHVYDPSTWTHVDNNYSFTIPDTTTVTGSIFQLSVGIDASDKAKNKALTSTAQYWLDTTPPAVDLDPPQVIEISNSTPRVCSAPFDPLGSASPNEGDVIGNGTIFRALVWDETNGFGLTDVLHHANIDPSSVRLYAQSDPSQPLLVAVHNSTVCDEIATEGMQNVTHPPVPFQLSPVDLAGSAFYGSKDLEVSSTVPDLCVAGTQTSPPDKLCSQKNSDMFHVINHAESVKEDVVYTTTSAEPLECTGRDLELSASIPNGWVCLAARAVDNAGNVGVSAPIRVCLNATKNPPEPAPACANSSVPRPSCVDNCTPPGHFLGWDPAFPVHYVRLGT